MFFADSGDAGAAARLAGYKKNPELKGRELLVREEIIGEIESLVSKRERLLRCIAAVGYNRLAFGDACGAVSLLYGENQSAAGLEGKDLFMISEIKKPKDGSIEIKFFDRLKALEKLENISGESGTKNLFDAIGAAGGSERDD